MPWTNPETFTAGQTLTAASMNAISGNLTELAPFMSAFTSWTPTLKQGATPTQTNSRSRYVKVGKLLYATAAISLTGSGTGGSVITLDFATIGTAASTDGVFGGFRHFDSGVTNYVGFAKGETTTALSFYVDAYGAQHGQQPANLSSGDLFYCWFLAELA
jgi:hypothetical protein